jgi:predicted MPP superfamily phosphohydrolase
MRGLGFVTLLNENKILKVGETSLMVAGVTDPVGVHMLRGHASDTTKALTSSEESQFKILLAHRPDACHGAESLGVDLQFSGHTHAGQFFPFSLFIGLAHKYYNGLYRHGNMWLYVNPGTGYWGPANRLGVVSEISCLTLTNIS